MTERIDLEEARKQWAAWPQAQALITELETARTDLASAQERADAAEARSDREAEMRHRYEREAEQAQERAKRAERTRDRLIERSRELSQAKRDRDHWCTDALEQTVRADKAEADRDAAQARAEGLMAVINDAIAIDKGEAIQRPQPHHPLLAIMAGNRAFMVQTGRELEVDQTTIHNLQSALVAAGHVEGCPVVHAASVDCVPGGGCRDYRREAEGPRRVLLHIQAVEREYGRHAVKLTPQLWNELEAALSTTGSAEGKRLDPRIEYLTSLPDDLLKAVADLLSSEQRAKLKRLLTPALSTPTAPESSKDEELPPYYLHWNRRTGRPE